MSIPGSASPLFLSAAAAAAPAGYEIERSLRFNSADDSFLAKSFGTEGSRTTWTWSGWIKRSALSEEYFLFSTRKSDNNANSTVAIIRITSDDILEVAGRAGDWYLRSDAVYRDLSAWYHIFVAVDTTSSTGDERVRAWVNGEEVTGTRNNPVKDKITAINQTAGKHQISGQAYTNDHIFNGYLADIHFIDGQALAPTDFGEYDDNNVWQPKAYSGTYGTNGFHFDFSDNSSNAALGTDSSGNNNTWTVNNLSVASGAGNDSLIDTPTNYEASPNNGGNYATFNAINHNTHSAYYTLSNGNLKCVAVGGSSKSSGSRGFCVSTLGMSSGKYYFELTVDLDDNNDHAVGIATAAGTGYYSTAGNWTYAASGNKFANSGSGASYGASYGNGDTIGVAFDADTGALVFYKNGTSQGTLATVTVGETYFFVWGTDAGTAQDYEVTANFGQRPFAYTPPTGYKSLCTTNLTDPTIADGSTAMDAVLYAGNGSTQTIDGLAFSPDLMWIKCRSDNSTSHALFDTIRGKSKRLKSDGAAAEAISATTVNSKTDGFTLNGNAGSINGNGKTFVAWTWDAGTSTVSNTDGTITSNVRANQSAGFSIVSWTGNATNSRIGHGLGAAPGFIILKNRDATEDWMVFHQKADPVIPEDKYLELNNTSAVADAGKWDDFLPTSTVFGVNGSSTSNGNNDEMIAYCFAPVEGFSAFGSYTGNGSTDGPFVYTGFRPRWLLIKSTGVQDWQVTDAARSPDNVVNEGLYLDLGVAEQGSDRWDYLANGFKARTTLGEMNSNGVTYIYAAFAEHPLRHARAR